MVRPEHYLPPEWAPRRAVWVGWPHLREEWGDAFDNARAEIAAFCRELARHVTVKLAAGSPEAAASASAGLGDVVQVHRIPTGDIWLRDTGPVFAADGGALIAHGFGFNGWGGRYVMPGDTETAAAIAAAEGAAFRAHPFILEGGAIDHDGAGHILTTRNCLLNPNRNIGWTGQDAETALAAALGARAITWLPDGLLNDHTDGHVDNIARFIAPRRVACQVPGGTDDPHYDRLLAVRDGLRAAGLETVEILSPGPVFDADGAPVPASHMNFVICNGAVIVPAYDEANCAAACAALAGAMPGYQIRCLQARAILCGGGSFHCMTCDIPEITA